MTEAHDNMFFSLNRKVWVTITCTVNIAWTLITQFKRCCKNAFKNVEKNRPHRKDTEFDLPRFFKRNCNFDLLTIIAATLLMVHSILPNYTVIYQIRQLIWGEKTKKFWHFIDLVEIIVTGNLLKSTQQREICQSWGNLWSRVIHHKPVQ